MTLHRDFVCGLLVLALAAAYFFFTTQIQSSQLADDVGPDGLPRVYSFALAALGLALTLRSIPKLKPTTIDADGLTKRAREWFQAHRAAGMLAVGIGYVILAPIIGYILSITLVILSAAVYQGTRPTLRLAGIALLGAIGLWLVFVWLLHIQQPIGLLPWLR
jgi:hypothetical protein